MEWKFIHTAMACGLAVTHSLSLCSSVLTGRLMDVSAWICALFFNFSEFTLYILIHFHFFLFPHFS